MGFEWDYCASSEKIAEVCAALKDFGLHVNAFYPSEYGDFTGLTKYDGPYTNEDEVFSTFWDGDVTLEDIKSRKVKPTRITLVKEVFERHLEDLKRGCGILHWHEIAFLTHINIGLLAALKEACKKHDCLSFFDNLVQSWDNQDAMMDGLTKQISQRLGVDIIRDRKW